MGKKKDSSGFNRPFSQPFEALKRRAGQTAVPAATTATATLPAAATAKPRPANVPAAAPPPATKPMRPTAAAAPKPGATSQTEDDQFFARAMRGVTALPAAERGRRASPLGPASVPAAVPARRAPARNDDADAEAELADMVDGGGRLTGMGDGAPGTHAGGAAGIDRRLVRRLRDGDYPIEGRLDLHGRTREEAQQTVERFIAQSQSEGRRCVLVIHGRGLNSGDAGPVLRDAVQRTLGSGRAARAVLAYTLAAPSQGADGATLVLLRKKK